jgi:hypothetical protein
MITVPSARGHHVGPPAGMDAARSALPSIAGPGRVGQVCGGGIGAA